ncbi:MAG: toxin-antitoxin system HicB family antitoxin [Polymorphobacter sp.]
MTAKRPFALRIDPALLGAIERIAATDLRSINGEIEMLLREALARRGVKVALSAPPRRGRPPSTPLS